MEYYKTGTFSGEFYHLYRKASAYTDISECWKIPIWTLAYHSNNYGNNTPCYTPYLHVYK